MLVYTTVGGFNEINFSITSPPPPKKKSGVCGGAPSVVTPKANYRYFCETRLHWNLKLVRDLQFQCRRFHSTC